VGAICNSCQFKLGIFALNQIFILLSINSNRAVMNEDISSGFWAIGNGDKAITGFVIKPLDATSKSVNKQR
jgi:hypothetical protein